MKNRTESKKTEREKEMYNMADKTMRNYDQIVRTMLRVQEEAGRCWTSLLTQGVSAHDWQRPAASFAAMANGVLPQAQKRMQEVLELAENNTRASVELMKKAADTMQTPGMAERQSKWLDLWATSLSAARSHTDAVMEITSRTMDSWIDLVQKSSETKPA